jgi:hypothetical protein
MGLQRIVMCRIIAGVYQPYSALPGWACPSETDVRKKTNRASKGGITE